MAFLFISSYQRKAQEDIDAVARYVAANLSAIGKSPDAIGQEDIKLFCKNTLYLRLVRTSSLNQEYAKETARTEDMSKYPPSPGWTRTWYADLLIKVLLSKIRTPI